MFVSGVFVSANLLLQSDWYTLLYLVGAVLFIFREITGLGFLETFWDFSFGFGFGLAGPEFPFTLGIIALSDLMWLM